MPYVSSQRSGGAQLSEGMSNIPRQHGVAHIILLLYSYILSLILIKVSTLHGYTNSRS
jgi:hypothetical protein